MNDNNLVLHEARGLLDALAGSERRYPEAIASRNPRSTSKDLLRVTRESEGSEDARQAGIFLHQLHEAYWVWKHTYGNPEWVALYNQGGSPFE